jgi:predicted transcriptional regulator
MDKPPQQQSPPPASSPAPTPTPTPTPITSPPIPKPQQPIPTPITSPVSPATQAPPQIPQAPFTLDWLIRQKPYLLISSLRIGGEQNMSSLAKKSQMSYVHAIEMLKTLEENGIVLSELKGHKRMVKLTEPGMQFALALEELVKKNPKRSESEVRGAVGELR